MESVLLHVGNGLEQVRFRYLLTLVVIVVISSPVNANSLACFYFLSVRWRDACLIFVYNLSDVQVQKFIFTESNKLIKSIQVFLNALNELRLCYVMERSSSVLPKRESSKASILNYLLTDFMWCPVWCFCCLCLSVLELVVKIETNIYNI